MITINTLMCKGCGYCIRFCPGHILEMGKEAVVASLNKKFGEKSPKIMQLNIAALEKGIELGSQA